MSLDENSYNPYGPLETPLSLENIPNPPSDRNIIVSFNAEETIFLASQIVNHTEVAHTTEQAPLASFTDFSRWQYRVLPVVDESFFKPPNGPFGDYTSEDLPYIQKWIEYFSPEYQRILHILDTYGPVDNTLSIQERSEQLLLMKNAITAARSITTNQFMLESLALLETEYIDNKCENIRSLNEAISTLSYPLPPDSLGEERRIFALMSEDIQEVKNAIHKQMEVIYFLSGGRIIPQESSAGTDIFTIYIEVGSDTANTYGPLGNSITLNTWHYNSPETLNYDSQHEILGHTFLGMSHTDTSNLFSELGMGLHNLSLYVTSMSRKDSAHDLEGQLLPVDLAAFAYIYPESAANNILPDSPPFEGLYGEDKYTHSVRYGRDGKKYFELTISSNALLGRTAALMQIGKNLALSTSKETIIGPGFLSDAMQDFDGIIVRFDVPNANAQPPVECLMEGDLTDINTWHSAYKAADAKAVAEGYVSVNHLYLDRDSTPALLYLYNQQNVDHAIAENICVDNRIHFTEIETAAIDSAFPFHSAPTIPPRESDCRILLP